MLNNKEIRLRQLTLHLKGMLDSIEPDLIDHLDQNGEWINASRGTHIIREGAPAGDIYLAISGRLQIVAGKGEKKRIVGDIPPGELIGEMSFFTGEPRSADVYALRDSVLLKLKKPVFDKLIAQHPALMNAIMCQLIKRLRKSEETDTMSRHLKTVAIIPANKETPVKEFTRQIVGILGGQSTARYFDKSLAVKLLDSKDAQLDKPDKSTCASLGASLDEQEDKYTYVIYVTDHLPNEWSRICVARADMVLITADTSSDADSELAKSILETDANSVTEPLRVLALMRKDSSIRPIKTSRWLNQTKAHHHFHIRNTNKDDMNRLARFLTDRTVGLTLSGGGARGFAHIGVVRAFREACVPIDVIGGTSMGACIGAMAALEYDEPTMVHHCKETFIHSKPFSKYTLPLVSILRHGVFDKSASNSFGEGDIEDCWIKYFCIASNLSKAEEISLCQGPLREAVLASMAMPGTVAPRIHSEGLLVDGGILNNLPADVMQQHAHIVVSVNTSNESQMQLKIDEFPSPWRLFIQKLLRPQYRTNVPGIMDIMMRSALLASAQNERRVRECSNLYLRPPVGDYKLMDMNKITEIVDAGYRYTKDMLEKHGDSLITAQ